METEKQEKVKLSRNELLEKARQAKADKKKAREMTQDLGDLNISVEKSKVDKIPKPRTIKPKIEVKEFETEKKVIEPEIVEEVVRVPGNRRKKIVKRTIELEESGTDEEIIEEVVRIPKMKKEVSISRDEMKKRLIESNKQRLHNELFS